MRENRLHGLTRGWVALTGYRRAALSTLLMGYWVYTKLEQFAFYYVSASNLGLEIREVLGGFPEHPISPFLLSKTASSRVCLFDLTCSLEMAYLAVLGLFV